jgi:hypothetical protein
VVSRVGGRGLLGCFGVVFCFLVVFWGLFLVSLVRFFWFFWHCFVVFCGFVLG